MAQPTTAPRAWYKAAPDPELPRISAKRAYGEVLVIYFGFFAAGIVAAALILANRNNDFGSTTNASWGVWMYQTVEFIGEIGLAVVAVLAIAAQRGVSRSALGLTPLRRPDGSLAVSQLIRICGWCFFAEIVGGLVNALLQSGHLPQTTANAPELIAGFFDAASAGIIEELVVLAFLVVTLRQAGRPWWEVTTVALVLRGAYHIYYGPGVFGILLWAALYFWIYLRFRQVLPLMLCHFMWDGAAFFSQRWSWLAAVGLLMVLAIWLACLILWLVDRGNRYQPVPLGAWGPSYGMPPYGGSYGGTPYGGPYGATPYGGPYGATPYGMAPGPVGVSSGSGGVGSGSGGVGSGSGGVGSGSGGVGSGSGGVGSGSGADGASSGPAGADATPTRGYPPPGWHPDPAGHNRWRWWNGQAWTDHVSQHAHL